jgi:hypothetical protein
MGMLKSVGKLIPIFHDHRTFLPRHNLAYLRRDLGNLHHILARKKFLHAQMWLGAPPSDD